MNKTDAKEIFENVVGGVNFMTPEILDFHYNDNFIIELSTGASFRGYTPFGVTVIENNEEGEWVRSKLSQCFGSLTSANNFIEELLNPGE